MKLIHDPVIGKTVINMGWVYKDGDRCPYKMSESQFRERVELNPQAKWIFSTQELSNEEIDIEFGE